MQPRNAAAQVERLRGRRRSASFETVYGMNRGIAALHEMRDRRKHEAVTREHCFAFELSRGDLDSIVPAATFDRDGGIG